MYSRVHFDALVTNSPHLTIPPSLRGPCLRAGQLTPSRLFFLLFHFPFSFSFASLGLARIPMKQAFKHLIEIKKPQC